MQNVRMSHKINDPASPKNERHEKKRRSDGGGRRKLLDVNFKWEKKKNQIQRVDLDPDSKSQPSN